MEMSREIRNTSGLLYPMMIIAAIAVIVFSILGIASITGWMPHAMLGARTAVAAQSFESPLAAVVTTESEDAAPAFQCVECGVVQSVRDIEQRGSLWAPPLVAANERTATTGL